MVMNVGRPAVAKRQDAENIGERPSSGMSSSRTKMEASNEKLLAATFRSPTDKYLLADGLKHPDWKERVKAARWLGSMKARFAVPSLVRVLSAYDYWEVRMAVVNALGAIGDARPEVISWLSHAMSSSIPPAGCPLIDNPLAPAAAKALGKLKGPGVLAALFKGLKLDNSSVLNEIENALIKKKEDPTLVPTLVAIAKDKQGPRKVRLFAVDLLVKLVRYKSIPMLLTLVKDKDRKIASRALLHLSSLAGKLVTLKDLKNRIETIR